MVWRYKRFNDGFVSYKHAAFRFIKMLIDGLVWVTGVG